MSDEIVFVETDSEVIESAVIEAYEEATGETLYPGDEKRLFLQNELPLIVGLKNDINDSAKMNLLRYARGTVLDAMGEFYRTARLAAKKATVTVRFTLSGVQGVPITIPAGTRVTPDGKLYFATTTALIISAGQTTGDVTAEATETGTEHNDFTSAQIKTIVDPVAFVASVSNTTTSSGGADTEEDDDYRERIRLAPESFSTAGPEGAYEYWARTADENISDVSVTSPSAGVVKVVVLMDDGALPSQGVLDAVAAALSPRDRRPLTDSVQTAAPTEVTYNIDITYYISTERQNEEAQIRAAIENAGGIVDQYVDWQKEKLDRAVNPDELRRRMLDAGAYRITVTNPAYTDIAVDAVAKLGTKTVTYGGLI